MKLKPGDVYLSCWGAEEFTCLMVGYNYDSLTFLQSMRIRRVMNKQVW